MKEHLRVSEVVSVFLLGMVLFFTVLPFQSYAVDETYGDVFSSRGSAGEEDTVGSTVALEREALYLHDQTGSRLNGPNLTPYRLSGWSSELVVSTSRGDHTDDSPLYDTDTLYLDYTLANLGNLSTYGQTFWVAVYVDSTEVLRNGPITSVAANHARYFEDQPLQLSAGTYTLTFVVDSRDQVAETDETDNQYSRTITIEEKGDEELRLLSLITDMGSMLRAGDEITFIANGVGQETVYYRFLYKAGYGTEDFNSPGGWTIARDWDEESSAIIVFQEADNYIVIVQASYTPDVWNVGDPQIGMNVLVKIP
jgi:hypothetical protein